MKAAHKDIIRSVKGSVMADMMDVTTVDEAIAMMSADPKAMETIMNSVKDNPEALAKILSQTGQDPAAMNRAMAGIMNNPKTKKETLTMSSDKKQEMLANVKAARQNMRAAMIDCVRFTQNGIPKKYMMKGDFPQGTIFEKGDMYGHGDDLCVFTTTSSREKNRVVSKIMGVSVFGEVVICRQCPNTLKYMDYTLSDAEQMKDIVMKTK